MRLAERILLLSFTYRDLRDKEQLASEEVVRLRARCDDLESRLDRAREDQILRERDLADRFMPPSKLGPQMRNSDADDAPTALSQPLNVQQWKKSKTSEFFDLMSKRRERLIHNAEEKSA